MILRREKRPPAFPAAALRDYGLNVALATGPHFANSSATNLVNSSGVIFSVSIASSARRFCTSGESLALSTPALIFFTMSAGIPFGPDRENQVVATMSG